MSTRLRRNAPGSPVLSGKTAQLAVSPKGVAHVVVENDFLTVRSRYDNTKASPPVITPAYPDLLNLWSTLPPKTPGVVTRNSKRPAEDVPLNISSKPKRQRILSEKAKALQEDEEARRRKPKSINMSPGNETHEKIASPKTPREKTSRLSGHTSNNTGSPKQGNNRTLATVMPKCLPQKPIPIFVVSSVSTVGETTSSLKGVQTERMVPSPQGWFRRPVRALRPDDISMVHQEISTQHLRPSSKRNDASDSIGRQLITPISTASPVPTFGEPTLPPKGIPTKREDTLDWFQRPIRTLRSGDISMRPDTALQHAADQIIRELNQEISPQHLRPSSKRNEANNSTDGQFTALRPAVTSAVSPNFEHSNRIPGLGSFRVKPTAALLNTPVSIKDREVVSISSSPSHTPLPNRQQQAIDPNLINSALQNVSNICYPAESNSPSSSNNGLLQSWDTSRAEKPELVRNGITQALYNEIFSKKHNDTIVKLYHDALLYLLWRANDNQMKISEESFNQYFSDAAATVEKKIAFLTDNIAAYCADGKTVKFKTWKKTGRPRFKGIPKLSACSVPWTPIENTKEKKRADRARIVTVSESLSSTIPSSRTVIEASDPPNPERVGTRLSDPIILDDTEQEQGNSCEVPPQRNASPVIIDLEPDLVEVLGNISQRRVHGRQSPEIILVSDDSASSSALSSPQLSPSPNFRSSSPMRPLRGSLSQEEFRRLTSDSGHDNCIVQSEDANRILKDFISANSDVFLREWRNVLAHLGMPCATQNVSQKRFRELGLSIEHVARTWIYDFPEFWRPVGMESQRVEAFVETFMDNWLSDSTDTITAPDNTPEDEGLNIEQRPEDVDHNTPAMAVQEGKLQPQIASPPPSPLLPSPPVDDEISHPVRRVIDLEGLDDQAPIAKSVIKPVIENNKPSQSQANIKVEQEMTPPETPPEDDEISPPVRYVINLDGLDNQAPITQSVIRQAKPVIENSKLSQPPTDIEAEHEMTTPETPPEDAASNRENQPLPPRMTDPFGLQEDDDEPSEIAGVLTSNKIPRKGRVVTTIGKVRSSAILTAKDFQLNDTLPKMRLEWQRTAWSSTRPLSFIAEARVDPVKNHTLVREKSLPRLKDEEQRIADKLIALDAEGRKLNDNYAEQLTSSLKVDWAKYQAVVQQQRAANEELSRRREKLSNDALTIAKATEQLKWTPDEMETPSTSMASASDSSDEVLLHGGFHRFVPPPRGPGERDEFLKDLLPWAKILDPSPPPLPRKRKYVRKKRRW